MDPNPLDDELLTINSIYPEDTLALLETTETGSRICSLRPPSSPSTVLRLEFPIDYPLSPPIILGTESIGADAHKGAGKRLVEKTKWALNKTWTGAAVVFDLIEELSQEQDALTKQQTEYLVEEVQIGEPSQSASEVTTEPEPPWTVLPERIDRKSVFVARCAAVTSPAQAKSFIAHLVATDKKAAKATHNISAYRIRGQSGSDITYQDCDDDGEAAAGGRMLHLMQLMDVWNVVVVVSRWYGGILLGSDRFRIINNAAKDVLVLGGFAKVEGKKK